MQVGISGNPDSLYQCVKSVTISLYLAVLFHDFKRIYWQRGAQLVAFKSNKLAKSDGQDVS